MGISKFEHLYAAELRFLRVSRFIAKTVFFRSKLGFQIGAPNLRRRFEPTTARYGTFNGSVPLRPVEDPAPPSVVNCDSYSTKSYIMWVATCRHPGLACSVQHTVTVSSVASTMCPIAVGDISKFSRETGGPLNFTCRPCCKSDEERMATCDRASSSLQGVLK